MGRSQTLADPHSSRDVRRSSVEGDVRSSSVEGDVRRSSRQPGLDDAGDVKPFAVDAQELTAFGERGVFAELR